LAACTLAILLPRAPRSPGPRLQLSSATVFGGDGTSAAGLLFQDSKKAMTRIAEKEKELIAPNTREIGLPKRSKRKGTSSGFGAGSLNKAQLDNALNADTIATDGVCLVPGVLEKALTTELRACVLDELSKAYAAVESEPASSVGRFNVPWETHDPLRGYLLLPLRDEQSVIDGVPKGPMVRCLEHLLKEGSKLAELFSSTCGGLNAEWYDLVALRTEPGAQRQPLHFDTPFQKVPGLFCAFIALQDVEYSMGTTVFLPGSQKNTKERRAFTDGQHDGSKERMLQKVKSRYALLQAGDAVVFDMRTLHAGTANLPVAEGGKQRLLFVLTFRNRKAKGELGHLPNLRPAYRNRGITLGEMRDELRGPAPFAGAASDGNAYGDGLVLEEAHGQAEGIAA